MIIKYAEYCHISIMCRILIIKAIIMPKFKGFFNGTTQLNLNQNQY